MAIQIGRELAHERLSRTLMAAAAQQRSDHGGTYTSPVDVVRIRARHVEGPAGQALAAEDANETFGNPSGLPVGRRVETGTSHSMRAG